ncbi:MULTISPECIES: hypothetical protein [unclassified Streptomyces]|uniref:hypothetical protein n=1 Tax=unclassified Streptomyces TaxID=2593676 RepID=UPI002DDC6A21|nr:MULTISPECIES: hypothetical protein [unclassified Streptomyces]WSB78915.1 hypothetical protein OHB04_26285 [Streptomyces sp. NBC_01775]WSS12883.1 hypothetical protein OG533_13945 [Streptomyces sp. NBC_01186]WSS41667.1 hypothetical protein OG220_14475 [Streptomyces sp. NBC_01187]
MFRKTTVAVAAAVVLTVPVVAGCSAVDKALDCANTAATVAQAADDLQQAASDANEDPTQAKRSLDKIDKNLKKIGDETDEGDVNKAVSKLSDAVDSVRTDLNAGRTPKTDPVGDAAGELTKVCTPG